MLTIERMLLGDTVMKIYSDGELIGKVSRKHYGAEPYLTLEDGVELSWSEMKCVFAEMFNDECSANWPKGK